MILFLNSHVKWFFLCALVHFVVNTPAHAGPKARCDAATFEFGTRISGAPITNIFSVVNRGNAALVISKVKDCCGVKSVVEPMRLEPGETARCRSIFTTKGRYGKQEKQILVATNDRRKPYLELRMTGELLRPVEYEPRYIKLGEVSASSEVELIITATNRMDEIVTLNSVESTIPGVRAEVVAAMEDTETVRAQLLPQKGTRGANNSEAMGAGAEETPQRRRGAKEEQENRSLASARLKHSGREINPLPRSWQIRVWRDGRLSEGKLMGQIRLHFSTGTVNVAVVGAVLPRIMATPEKIQISSRGDEPVKRMVMLRSAEPFKIAAAELEHAEGDVSLKMITDSQCRLEVSVRPSTIQPRGRLRVLTDGGAELCIPLVNH